MSTTPLRSRTAVVNLIATALSSLDHVGLTVAPIQASKDIDDKVPGDYHAQVYFRRKVPGRDDVLIAAVFQVAFRMYEWRGLSEKALIECIESLVAAAKAHSEVSLDDVNVDVHTADGRVIPIADFKAEGDGAER